MFATRRSLLSSFAALFLAHQPQAAERAAPQRPREAKKTTLVNQIASLRNSYDKWWSKGGELCAATFNLPYLVLQSEGDFKQNGMRQLSDTISQNNGNVVFNLDAPSSSTDLHHLVDLCTSHQVYFVTQNNMPPSRLRPWTLSPYYVAHIDFDHKLAGFKTARELITLMGDKVASSPLGERSTILSP